MKSRKSFQKILEPTEILCLVFMALFALAALLLKHYRLAAAEGAVFLVLLVMLVVARQRKAKALDAYIESITYDTENAKNSTLLSFPLPMAVFRLSNSEVVWGNDAFFAMFGINGPRLDSQLAVLIPDFSGKWLMEGKTCYPSLVEIRDRKYQMYGNLIRGEKDDENNVIMGITYWLDVTDYDNTRILYERSRPIPGVIVLDNLDELMRNYPDRVKNDIRENVEERLHRWSEKYHGILRRYDRDRYLAVFEKKDLDEMRRDQFPIVAQMHEVENPSGIPASISIGFGEDAGSLEEGLQFADIGTELAISRGGDQTVIKNRLSFEFFGGRGFEIEKRTKVKSRGICCMARKQGIKAHVIIDQSHNASQPLLERAKKDADYRDVFLSPHEAMIMADARTLLVVVDTNRPESVEDGSLLASCNRVAVIDHHRVGATYIQNAALGFIEPYASSTCELVTEILQELMEPTEMTKLEAEALLAGIVLDTKSFSIRTGERTFDAAAWLRRAGAETAEVKKLFQIDMDTTVARYKLMQNARLYQGIAVVVTDEMQSRIVSAQAADELLNISGVEASVVASPDGEGGMYVSARSIGEMNVQILMEKLGGGGNRSAAAARLADTTPKQAEEKILTAINEYFA